MDEYIDVILTLAVGLGTIALCVVVSAISGRRQVGGDRSSSGTRR